MLGLSLQFNSCESRHDDFRPFPKVNSDFAVQNAYGCKRFSRFFFFVVFFFFFVIALRDKTQVFAKLRVFRRSLILPIMRMPIYLILFCGLITTGFGLFRFNLLI